MHVPVSIDRLMKLRHRRPADDGIANHLVEVAREIVYMAVTPKQRFIDYHVNADIAEALAIWPVARGCDDDEVARVSQRSGDIEGRARGAALGEVMGDHHYVKRPQRPCRLPGERTGSDAFRGK